MKFFTVSITYSQGLLKRWLVPVDTLALDFTLVAGRRGKIRSMTFGPELDATAAEQLIAQGAAVFYPPTKQVLEAVRG